MGHNKLHKGDRVLVSFEYGASTKPEIHPMSIALLQHLFSKGIKVYTVPLWPEGLMMAKYALVEVVESNLFNIKELQNVISKIITEKGPIEILINNAANDERHNIEDVTEEFWNNRMNINLRHYFFTVQSVREAMIKNKGGVIVNIGSASWMVGQGGMAAYTAAKSGVVGLTRSFARDLGEYNIRVNSVVPGWTITERQLEKWLTPESEADMMKKQCIKKRLMPSDIAKAVLFFSSDQSSGCTNQSYVVDNGWL